MLAAQPATRRIAALGDMRELGPEAAAMHAGLAPDLVAACDLVFTCGEMMGHLGQVELAAHGFADDPQLLEIHRPFRPRDAAPAPPLCRERHGIQNLSAGWPSRRSAC